MKGKYRNFASNLLVCLLVLALMFSGVLPAGLLGAAGDEPLSVAGAIANQDGSIAGVTGYIVGTTGTSSTMGGGNFDGPFTLATNILLADSPDERDVAKVIPVQLPSGAVRAALNLVDNPDNLGKKVIVTGQLTAYFGVPGLRSASAYEFVGETVEPISVAGAIANQDGSIAAVLGHIVGTTGTSSTMGGGNFDGPFTLATNILLADSPDERDVAKVIPVQLPSGAVRAALNLVDNPGNLGKKVIVTGQLSAYFGVPGLRSASAYTFVDDVEEPDHITIAAARALPDGERVTVKGVVTSKPGNWGGQGFYIQDGTGGIYAYTATAGLVNRDETVFVTGTLGVYNGERQLTDLAVEIAEAAMPVPQPEERTVAATTLEDEGLLIRLPAVKILQLTQVNTFGTFEMIVEDHTGALLVRVDNRIGLTMADFPGEVGDYYEITGIIGQFNGILQVKPRDPAELIQVEEPVEPGVTPIAAAKSLADGEAVTVAAVVTAPDQIFGASTFYVQDASAGIQIFKSGVPFTAAYGDRVRLSGTLGTYRGERQLALTAAEVVEQGVDVPPPKTIAAGEAGAHEGLLVVLERVTITAMGAPDQYGNINIAVSDETGSVELRIDSRTGIDYSALGLHDDLRLVGISGKFFDTIQVKPRFQDDIAILPPADAMEPVIYRLAPPHLSATYNRRPVVGASVRDDYALDWDSLQVVFNGEDITSRAAVSENRVEFIPEEDLAFGMQQVSISVTNEFGYSATRSWQFDVIEERDFIFIYGVPHSHTSYSDGAGTPAEAYAYAMEQGLDYLFVTDHSNWLVGDLYDSANNQFLETPGSEWHETRMQAEAFNAEYGDVFTALRGFEMTFRDVGHINVYNTAHYVERDTMPSLRDFYDWLLAVSEDEDVVALFNHPNWPDDSFNNLAYVPELDHIIQLIEVANGAPPYSYVRAEGHYIKALDQGWHLGAVNSQDNHARNWGRPDNLTGLVVAENSPEGILEAFQARRTYATETRKLEMTYKANGYWMGSIVADEVLDFAVELYDPDVAIEKVEIITNGGRVLETYQAGGLHHVQWDYSHTPGTGRNWYYLRVTHVNGALAWSSPIFTAPGEVDVKLIDLKADPNPNIPGAVTAVTATVANMGIFEVTDITVDFYAGSISPENKFDTVVIPSLYAGRQAKAATEIVFKEAGDTRIYAVLHVVEDGLEISGALDRGIKIVPSIGKNLLLDVAHNNDYAPGTLIEFVQLMRFHGYNVIMNSQPFTADLLGGMDIVVLTHPDTAAANLTGAEMESLAQWVQDGGSLLLAAKSNYNNDSTRLNPLLEKMGSGIRINHDNVYETDPDNYTGGMEWSVLARTFPDITGGMTDHMEFIRIFSSASLVDENIQALQNNPETGLEIIVQANPTSYNFNVQPGYYTYNAMGGDQGRHIPLVARENIGGGRLVAMGRAIFSDFELGGNFANDRLILELVDWLAGYERAVPIAAARSDYRPGDLVTVSGIVTAPTGLFFDVFYIEDESGGIAVYGAQGGDLPPGTEVLVTGTLELFEGELELAYQDWQVQVMKSGPTGTQVQPVILSNAEAMSAANQGRLITTYGKVTEIDPVIGAVIIDDGSGPALIYIDGYLDIDTGMIDAGEYYIFTGLGSHGSAGPRLRIRYQEDISDRIVFAMTRINRNVTVSVAVLTFIDESGKEKVVVHRSVDPVKKP